ncbi:MAG TPA: SRPBCC family protein [candidate division Zixibacteria bacterium]|jgi:uncharacterized protein YndB with AHSA1/START domain
MTDDVRFDWSQFRLGIYIQNSPEHLYRLWTTPSGLIRWFLRTAAFAAADGPPKTPAKAKSLPPYGTLKCRHDDDPCGIGDRYRWEWYYDGGISGEGWIIDVRPPTRLEFTFGDRMEVTVSIRKQGSYSEVDLRQHGIPVNARARHELHMGCRQAWTFFLANLKSVAEGGLDLRETERGKSKQLHLVNI